MNELSDLFFDINNIVYNTEYNVPPCNTYDSSFETTEADIMNAKKHAEKMYRTSNTGLVYWNPIELNVSDDDSYRADIQDEFSLRTIDGTFSHVETDFMYQSSDQNNQIPVAVNIFHKIKVYTCMFSVEHVTRDIMKSRLFPLQNITASKTSNTFLQQVVKSYNPIGTLARYKLSENLCYGHIHTKCAQSLIVCNVNMPRQHYEMITFLRCNAAKYLIMNSYAHMVPLLRYIIQNNQSVTLDSVISSVEREDTFKATLSKNVCPIKIIKAYVPRQIIFINM